MKKTIYLVLAILGIILPMSQFIPASLDGEFSVAGMVEGMTANRTMTGVTLDFMVAVVTGFIFGVFEAIRLKITLAWIPLIGTVLIGFSFGLPFFLYLRELAVNREAQA